MQYLLQSVFCLYVFQFPLLYYFLFPCTILNAVEPRELEVSHKVGKKPLSTFGITLYLIIIKVFYGIYSF